MNSNLLLALEVANEEIDDYREFVKSANTYLQYETSLKAISERDNDLHNLRTMCDYLMNRYIK